MRRTLKELEIGDHSAGRKRYRLTIEDEFSGPEPTNILGRQFGFLQALVDQPNLMACGPVYPNRFVVYHNGTCWVLQAEAEVDQP